MKEWIKDKFETSKDWVMDRKDERTSLDGIALIAMGVIALFFTPFVKFALRCNRLWCVHFNKIRVVIWTDLETEVELLKSKVSDMEKLHVRLDDAIGKISEVSNCINRMLRTRRKTLTTRGSSLCS